VKNVKRFAIDILATEVADVDPKIGNRIKQMKEIYQKMKVIELEIATKIGSLQKELKTLEKQTAIFEKELMPVLKELQDHSIKAEGIYIELKSGRRSPKVGYEYLAEKVNSQLLAAAEEVIAKAAEFAQSPSITMSSSNGMKKRAGVFDWIKEKWNKFTGWIKSLSQQSKAIGKDLFELDKMTV
jgi:hypothetical protein